MVVLCSWKTSSWALHGRHSDLAQTDKDVGRQSNQGKPTLQYDGLDKKGKRKQGCSCYTPSYRVTAASPARLHQTAYSGASLTGSNTA